MRAEMKILPLIAGILLTPSVCLAGWLGPSNYDECIFKNMKGVTSDRAATAIGEACRRQFPKPLVKPAEDPNDPFSNFYEMDAYYKAVEARAAEKKGK
jgi:hypothetical protein